jgi:hypothetical protein
MTTVIDLGTVSCHHSTLNRDGGALDPGPIVALSGGVNMWFTE